MRRKVLDDELASEEKLLGEARVAYGNGAPQPLPDEQNDAEKYRQRIAKLRQTVQLHERNVEALRKEIDRRPLSAHVARPGASRDRRASTAGIAITRAACRLERAAIGDTLRLIRRACARATRGLDCSPPPC